MADKNPMSRDVPESIKESLAEIIDYLWAEELKHVREVATSDVEVYFGQHIFAHLVRIRAWLEPGYVPADFQGPAKLLAKYALLEMGCFGLPVEIENSARHLLKSPGHTASMRQVVDYLEDAIAHTDYWGPPEEVWDALEEIREWLHATAV